MIGTSRNGELICLVCGQPWAHSHTVGGCCTQPALPPDKQERMLRVMQIRRTKKTDE